MKQYFLEKLITDADMEKLGNTFVQPNQVHLIIDSDADVFTKDGKLLFRFRKNKLPLADVLTFRDNVQQFARQTTTNRGSACGSLTKNVWENPKIMSNIMGYMDTLSPQQKYRAKLNGITIPLSVRPCRFNLYYPEKWKEMIPLIQAINNLYAKLVPDKYRLQKKKADETHFRIGNTAFTSITTNLNFQTSIHCDKGDDEEGFGNLCVIENGGYTGAETCLPQYGVGVNVRNGDVLFMDVHEWHGNLPRKQQRPDGNRLSIVCYLRKNVWLKTKGLSKPKMLEHIALIDSIRQK